MITAMEQKSKPIKQKGKNKLVNSIIINDNTELVFSIWEVDDKKFAGIRKYIHTKKYTGPTRSGITFSKNNLEKIMSFFKEESQNIPNQRVEAEISKIEKSQNSHIVISLRESTLDNHPVCIDMREYVKSPSYEGPTKKGFRFSVHQLEEFVLNCEDLIKLL
ncbi:hypothetical protein ACFLRW_07480 [Acidobacteriota bacterium]